MNSPLTTSDRLRARPARLGGKSLLILAAVAAATLLTAGSAATPALPDTAAPAATADASAGAAPVVVHGTDLTDLHGYHDLDACSNAPFDAHTVFNVGDEDVVLYADDRCETPLVTVGPGFGSHIAPGQSFSAVKGDLDLAPFATTADHAVEPGKITIFEHEVTQLSAFENPDLCHNAPALAHTIANLTDRKMVLFADERCGVPLAFLEAGSGSHVAPGQSFQAADAAGF